MRSYKYFEEHKTLMFTPEDISKDIILQLPINKNDTVLEPFKGEGSFYNQLPECKKLYCEKDENINFFDWQDKVDWIVSNPPFKILVDNKPTNGLIPIIEHSMTITSKGFGYLVNNRLFNPTPKLGSFIRSPGSVNNKLIKLLLTCSLTVWVPLNILTSLRGKATPIVTFLLISKGLILLFPLIYAIKVYGFFFYPLRVIILYNLYLLHLLPR